MAEERTSIVNFHRLNLAGQLVRAFLDKRFCHGRHIRNRAVEPECRVDAVGQQITGYPAARGLGIESPESRTALR